MTTHDYASHPHGMTAEHQRPEGALIQAALKRSRLSARKAADRAGLSDARWRQIVNGYQSVGGGQTATVVGPADTIARMAAVVGVTPAELRQAGRPDAAAVLAESVEVRAGRESLGMSHSELAELLGVGPKTLAKWEQGDPIPQSVLERLRAVLAQTPDDVLLAEVQRRFQTG